MALAFAWALAFGLGLWLWLGFALVLGLGLGVWLSLFLVPRMVPEKWRPPDRLLCLCCDLGSCFGFSFGSCIEVGIFFARFISEHEEFFINRS